MANWSSRAVRASIAQSTFVFACLLAFAACEGRSGLAIRRADAGHDVQPAGAGGKGGFGGGAGQPSGGGGNVVGSGDTGGGGDGGGGDGGNVGGGGDGGTLGGGGDGGSVGGGGGSSSSSSGGGGGGMIIVGGGGGNGGRGGSGGNIADARDSMRDLGGDRAGDALPVGVPVIDPGSKYLQISTGKLVMNGFMSKASDIDSSIDVTRTSSSFCAKGMVAASPTYNSWAVTSFNVNQQKSGGSGSTGSLDIVGDTMTINYANNAGSTIELQFWDGSNFWCYYLPRTVGSNTITIPLSSLNTKCWDNSGDSFASGTPITSVQFAVPCSATVDTHFDYCFLGLTIN